MTSDEILTKKKEEEAHLTQAQTASDQVRLRSNIYQLEMAYQLALRNERDEQRRPLRKVEK
jgi:hypothetical protein